MSLEELKLSPYAHECARRLSERFPQVVFTSGRRDLSDQARVMALNIVDSQNRNWIKDTYVKGHLIQPVIDAYPDVKSVEALSSLICLRLKELEPEQVMLISAHLTGDAFDIRPLTDTMGVPTSNGWEIIDFIRRSLEGSKMLLKEGGAIRWHVQFPRNKSVEV